MSILIDKTFGIFLLEFASFALSEHEMSHIGFSSIELISMSGHGIFDKDEKGRCLCSAKKVVNGGDIRMIEEVV